MARTPTSIRISAEGRRLLAQLAEHLGVTKSAVLELAIRSYSESQGLTRTEVELSREGGHSGRGDQQENDH
jgi:predicted transcriptional regulator